MRKMLDHINQRRNVWVSLKKKIALITSNIVPLGRLGTADETTKAVVFLASDDSSYITGTELFVDGGFAQV